MKESESIMAKYLNIYKEKNIVIRKAYDGDFSKWIAEHDYMAVIETDDGVLIQLPVMADNYLNSYTADDYLNEAEDEDIEILMPCDCPARDRKISDNITEWICNEGAVDDCSIVEAICSVVSLLTKYGMWKDEYAKHIDINVVKEYYKNEQ